MTKPSFSEERIAAFVDGSIDDPAEAEAIARAIEADPEVRAVAERVERSNALLREAFAAPLSEGVPPAIAAAIASAGTGSTAPRAGSAVVAFRRRVRPAVWVPTAAAAAVALALGFGGIFDERAGDAPVLALGPVPEGAPLHRALEALPAGSRSAEGIEPLLSFRDGAGRPCREIEAAPIGAIPAFAIACRAPEGGWTVEALATVAAPDAPPGGEGGAIRPASGGAEGDPLASALDRLGAGPALAPAEEARLIARGWSAE
jgi:hypothetical protein